jgi:hypothetical protein
MVPPVVAVLREHVLERRDARPELRRVVGRDVDRANDELGPAVDDVDAGRRLLEMAEVGARRGEQGGQDRAFVPPWAMIRSVRQPSSA